jgi:general nucleoside transport system permease protein
MSQAESLNQNTKGGSRRRRNVGIFLLVEAAALFLLLTVTKGMVSTFVLASNRGGVNVPAPDLVIPTWVTILTAGILVGLAGIWQLVKGFKRYTNTVLIAMIGLGVIMFLVWAARGKSLNLTGMLVSSVISATPIALAALSGIYSERSGVVNIGIEGMMLMGSFVSVVVASVTHNLTLGFLTGAISGLILGALHAVLSIRYRVNQIISGTGIIILALGITNFLYRTFLNPNPNLNNSGKILSALPIPFLWRIPVIGPILFNQSPVIYIMFLMILFTHFFFNYTKWGLRIRSVGENPKAADTLGINVFPLRYLSVLISGTIAGFAGAHMSIGQIGFFSESMSAGKGFLGLAAMIFGNWNPGGAFLGSIIFGFFDSWQDKLSILQVGIPSEFLGMAPYIATMIVLAGFIGRARMPASDGTPYKKE